MCTISTPRFRLWGVVVTRASIRRLCLTPYRYPMVRHSRWYIQSRQNSRQPIHVSQVGRRYVELQMSSIVQELTRRLDAQLDSRNYGGRGNYAASPASQYREIPWTWPTKTRQSLAYDESSSDPRLARVMRAILFGGHTRRRKPACEGSEWTASDAMVRLKEA
jgi:hypothetical protein